MQVFIIASITKNCNCLSIQNVNINNVHRGLLNPQSGWLQSSSESEDDIDEQQFLLNANDLAADDSDAYISDDNLNDFDIHDEFIDDDLDPDAHNPVPAHSDTDTTSNRSYPDSELDPDNYLLDPEGLNLLNIPVQDPDSDLEHYLVGPDRIYLDNQGFSDNDSVSVPDLDPEPPSGPVDPG